MSRSLKELGVVVGYKCNFRCAHCCFPHDGSQGLAAEEKTSIVSAIRSYAPRSILFVGGETSLYVDTINEILSAVPDLSGSSIRVTTNGHFAGTLASAVRVLRSFKKLDTVQLSYDKFHSKFLPFSSVKNLFLACKSLGKGFRVLYTVASPLELAGIKELGQVGKFKILVSKVMSAGEAARNGIEYLYPSYDAGVLRRRCPARDTVSYICGRGFSVCCSLLNFETDVKVSHPTIAAHKRSRFYRLISKMTFGELLKRSGLPPAGLPPQFSAECNICAHIFKNGGLLS